MMSPIVKYFLFIGIVLLTLFLVNGCTEEIPVLTQEDRIIADSIVRAETKLIIKEIDSLCALEYKESFDRSVDSISKVRLKEIENYIPTK